MAACLVLGMGMPTVPAYLIIVLVMGPALAKMGISIVAAHLFAVYYAVRITSYNVCYTKLLRSG